MTARTSRAGILNSGRAARGGFTLFELLVVMVLLTLIAGLAIPSMGMMDTRGGLEKAAARIRGAVYETRTRAMLARRTAELRFSGRRMRMVLAKADDVPEEEIGSADLPEGVEILGIRVEGMDSKATTDRLAFHPRGLTLPAVVQIGEGHDELTLFIPPMTDAVVMDGLLGLETAKMEYKL